MLLTDRRGHPNLDNISQLNFPGSTLEPEVGMAMPHGRKYPGMPVPEWGREQKKLKIRGGNRDGDRVNGVLAKICRKWKWDLKLQKIVFNRPNFRSSCSSILRFYVKIYRPSPVSIWAHFSLVASGEHFVCVRFPWLSGWFMYLNLLLSFQCSIID